MLATAVMIAGCGGDDTNPINNIPDDGRPEGTVLMLIPFNAECEFTNDTYGYLYDDLPSFDGELIDSQRVDDHELRFYLPPETGLYWLVVRNKDEVFIPEVSFQTSEKDLQFDPPLVCE